MCRLVGIDRQKYYRSKAQVQSRKDLATKVISLVQPIRAQMPRLGGKKLYHLLNNDLKPLKIGRDKFFDILRANSMLIRAQKQYHVTTNSFHRFKKHKNKIESLKIERPEQVWVSDITYIGTRENPMYLALVTDAYSKQIMGYDVSASLDSSGCERALKCAHKNRKYPNQELIHHSDRGVQYCSDEYQKLLKHMKIKCSMTESYDPYANAVAERINGVLKQEFITNFRHIELSLMKKIVAQSIKAYNLLRPHWSCELLTPAKMHQQQELKYKSYKKTQPQDKLKTELLN